MKWIVGIMIGAIVHFVIYVRSPRYQRWVAYSNLPLGFLLMRLTGNKHPIQWYRRLVAGQRALAESGADAEEIAAWTIAYQLGDSDALYEETF